MSAAILQLTTLLGVLLFGLGLTGIVLRRNVLAVLLGFQLMGVGAVVTLAAFAHFHADDSAQVMALIATAAGVGQAMVLLSLLCLRHRRGGDTDLGKRSPEFEG